MSTAVGVHGQHDIDAKSAPSLLGLLFFGLLPFVVAFVGSQFTSSSVDSDWYRALDKPAWNPPSWVFAPVWSTLYLLMGIAAWRIWLTRPREAGLYAALGLWGVQLAINLAWSYVFFDQRSVDGGVVVILALLVAIVATMLAFAMRSRLAALLLVPYLAWVGFATSINVAIWQLN